MPRILPLVLIFGLAACGTSDSGANVRTDTGADDTGTGADDTGTGTDDTGTDDTGTGTDDTGVEDTGVDTASVDVTVDSSEDDTFIEPVDAGSGQTCESATSCGGDPIGDYRFAQYCPIMKPSSISSCDGAFDQMFLDVSGEFHFYADGTFELSGNALIHTEQHVPASCPDSTICEAQGGLNENDYCIVVGAEHNERLYQDGTWEPGDLGVVFTPNGVQPPYDAAYCVTSTGLSLLMSADGMDIVVLLERVR